MIPASSVKISQMGMLKEFREFAIKGNILDLAVAVIIGTAFGKIVTALTSTLIMPLVSLVLGKGGVMDLSVSVNGTIFPIEFFPLVFFSNPSLISCW
jgi:large conductance mechanosensitive channel